MQEKISESRFYMWRTLFAVAHADDVVTSQERNFMNKALEEEPFTETQREILKLDVEQRQDIRFLFSKISDQQDRSLFFHHARTLVWADGDFGGDEQSILLELQKEHNKTVDFETFETEKGLRLEEDDVAPPPVRRAAPARKNGLIARVLRVLGGA